MEGIETPNGAEREFIPGELVKVKRSSGEMEDGWEVKLSLGGRVQLEKDGLRKMPTVEDLREWNS